MRADRPMNEYEAAAIWGLCTVCECLIDQGVLPAEPLLSALKALRDSQAEMGAREAAGSINMIMSCIEPPRPSS